MSMPATSRCAFASRHVLKLPKLLVRPRARCHLSTLRRASTQAVSSTRGAAERSPSLPAFNGFTSRMQEGSGGGAGGGHEPPESREIKLGRTLRVLQERMPTLLQSPLPIEILSPHIRLHLFPSTHPHLPTVSGRMAYIAALWTSPIAWNRVPIVGNVRLEILSERMVKNGLGSRNYSSDEKSVGSEQLIVRWRTVEQTRSFLSSAAKHMDKVKRFVSGEVGLETDADKNFTGLFIFEFDEKGRIITHTIEHIQEGGNWERGVGAKFMTLTDWLLGGWKKETEGAGACPAFIRLEEKQKIRSQLRKKQRGEH